MLARTSQGRGDVVLEQFKAADVATVVQSLGLKRQVVFMSWG